MTTRKKNGRPTVMTIEVIEKLEGAFLLGCSDNEACFIAKISPAALYNYQDKHPEFTERKTLMKEYPTYLARQAVTNGFKRDPNLALKYLERKAKAEFSLRTETDITTDGQPLKALVEFIDARQSSNTNTD